MEFGIEYQNNCWRNRGHWRGTRQTFKVKVYNLIIPSGFRVMTYVIVMLDSWNFESKWKSRSGFFIIYSHFIETVIPFEPSIFKWRVSDWFKSYAYQITWFNNAWSSSLETFNSFEEFNFERKICLTLGRQIRIYLKNCIKYL